MVLVLGLLPFLVVVFTALVLGNAGRTSREKVSLFFRSPDDTDKASSDLIKLLRACFWISLSISIWIVSKIFRFTV